VAGPPGFQAVCRVALYRFTLVSRGNEPTKRVDNMRFLPWTGVTLCVSRLKPFLSRHFRENDRLLDEIDAATTLPV
jgi:hypothetical protein